MAATVSNRQELIRLSGNRVMLIADITLDTAYPTGGTPGITALLGLAAIDALDPLQHQARLHEYVPATDSLRTHNPSTGVAGAGAEVANATNLSGTTVRCLVIGRYA